MRQKPNAMRQKPNAKPTTVTFSKFRLVGQTIAQSCVADTPIQLGNVGRRQGTLGF